MTDFNQLAAFAIDQRASDIHISSDMPPMIRVDGNIKEVRIDALTSNEILSLLHKMMNDDQKKIYENDWELDFSIVVPNISRFRVNAFYTTNGPSAAFRAVPVAVKSLAELEIPAIIKSLTLLPKGLILVTGPTGSGKSTTLAAMIQYINQNQDKHIITIEEPIEFIHKSKKSLINQREVGVHTRSYAKALKSALREDPDVILIGEIRDIETMSLALTAAETGHLILGTLHTSSAAQTINRIIDIFPAGSQGMIRSMLATSLEAVIAQRLIKRKNNFGRIAAFEIMVATSAVRNLIRENKIPQISSMIQLGSKDGMMLMSDHIQQLVNNEVVAQEDVYELLKSSEEMMRDQSSQRSKNVNNLQVRNNFISASEEEEF